MKVLSPALGNDPEFRLRFEREARLASALDHPHICTIFDVGHDNGVAYLVMQHVWGHAGGSTHAWRIAVRGGPRVRCGQITSALVAAHNAGILHRDLKPANIMVAEGSVKILDFGLAKSTGGAAGTSEETGAVASAGVTLTRSGSVMGTPVYMSPEQVEARHLDARSDLFSFGALFYELLTGRRAFTGDSSLTTAFAVVNTVPPPVGKSGPIFLWNWITSCAAASRRIRLIDTNRPPISTLRFERARSGLTPADKRAHRRRRVLAIAAGVVVVLATASLVWTARRQARVREALDRSLPEIARLSAQGDYPAAFRLALDAERYIPADTRLAELLREISLTASIGTDPPGAEVRIKEYAEPDAPWQVLGQHRCRACASLADSSDGTSRNRNTCQWKRRGQLKRGPPLGSYSMRSSVPSGMVRVRPPPQAAMGLTGLDHLQLGVVPDFFIDRHEVTNRSTRDSLPPAVTGSRNTGGTPSSRMDAR